MTDQTSAPDADLRMAVETMLSRLEREHAWAQELRADLDHTEREIAKLLSACDAAIHAVPYPGSVDLMHRASKIAAQDYRPGRPPRDRRYTVMLHYLASGRIAR